MDHDVAKALCTEFVRRLMEEAGAESAQAIAVRLPMPGLAAAATVTGVLMAESPEILESLVFRSALGVQAEGERLYPPVARTRGYRFINHGGESIERGKKSHPDSLRLYIDRAEALSFALDILRQLEHPRDGEAPRIEIPLYGQLGRVIEDDIQPE